MLSSLRSSLARIGLVHTFSLLLLWWHLQVYRVMGIGNIFVATTLAPLVVVLASVSLQLLTMGLEQLKKWSSHSYSKNALWPVIKKVNHIINTKCFGDMEIDLKSFNNVMLMAILMALIGVALSMGGVEDAAKAARAASTKPKAIRNGTTPSKALKKTK